MKWVSVCVGASTPDAVRAFYNEQLRAKGWEQSFTFPYGGELKTQCGDPYCWRKNPGNFLLLYMALENVRAVGATTTFTLREIDYTV